MLIECKGANTSLNRNHLNQLLRYYSVSDIKIAVLTNGIVYRFYTDYNNLGRMDEDCFLEIDLRNLSSSDAEALRLFTCENFSNSEILDYVGELKYRMRMRDAIIGEVTNPSEDTVRWLQKSF